MIASVLVSLAKAHDYSLSSSDSIALSESDSDQHYPIRGGRKKPTVRFSGLKRDEDLVSAIKTKRHHHAHRKDEMTKRSSLKSISYFSSSKPVFQESSYISASGSRHPRLPGGPQKVGFTFSRSWQREIEKNLLKGQKKKPSSERGPSNGLISKFASETKGIVKDPVDAGWWLVSFEAGRSEALNTFKFKTKRSVTVSVVDLFCRGDSFAVLDEGKLIAQTSRVRADSKCRDIVTSPQVAIEDGRWSSVVFDLEAGKHSISLRVIDNPNDGGMLAIRFEKGQVEQDSDDSTDEDAGIFSSTSESTDSASSSSSDRPSKPSRSHFSRSQVCSGYNGFVVIEAPFSMKKAGKACERINAKLANLNGKRKNYEAAVKSVYTCLGSNKLAWVDAKDNDGVADLVLKVEKGGKSGILTQPTSSHPVLCQVN